MMVALPSNVGIGYVTGTFTANGNTAADPTSRLSFTFTPTVSISKDATASPSPMSIVRLSRTFTVNIDGKLVDESGVQPIAIIATDDSDLSPVSSYTVTSTLTGSRSPFPAFLMDVPTGTTVDLTTVLPTAKADDR